MRFLTAAIQMNSGGDKQANIDKALQLIAAAARQGARLIALPEYFSFLGSDDERQNVSEPIPGGPTVGRLAQAARQHGVVLHGGTILEGDPLVAPRVYNTSVVLDEQGRYLGSYRKIHLFDVNIPGQVESCESYTLAPGAKAVVLDSSFAKLGLTICYDLRFPELFRTLALRGAEVIFVPAAFSLFTGKDHWEPLLRSRAIENQVYIIAPAQTGCDPVGRLYFGGSMIIDPWGTVVAQAPAGEGFALGMIELEKIGNVQRQVPCRAHRRLDAYDLGRE